MLTTGLVSLNVHEALTFDGTEIVLHPDLFFDGLNTVNSLGTARHPSNIRPSPSTATGVSSAGGSATGAAVTVGPASSTTNVGVGSDTTNKDGSPSQPQQQPGSQAPQASSSQQQPSNQAGGGANLAPATSWAAGTPSTATAAHNHRRLEVGDMIEIRVWDPLSARNRQSSPGGVSAVFRKRTPAASVHSAQSSTGSISTATQKPAAKQGTGMATPSSTAVDAKATGATTTNSSGTAVARTLQLNSVASSAESMQYSENSTLEHASAAADIIQPISSKSMTPMAARERENPQEPTSPVKKAVGDSSSVVNKPSNKDVTAESTAMKALTASPISLPSTKTVITIPNSTTSSTATAQAGKPPVSGGVLAGVSNAGARTRALNSSDVPRLPTTSTSTTLPKPPLQPRASTHGSYELRKRSPKPIHSREISDMTIDSTMGHGLVQNLLSSSQNINPIEPSASIAEGDSDSHQVDFQVPLGVDLVDGEDDTDGGQVEEDEDDQTHGDDTLSLIGKTHVMRFSFVMLVTEKTLTSLKGSARTQVSMLRQVADLYKLSSYDMVSINRIEKEDEAAVLTAVSADFVLLTIKDQFISRGDMHLFQKALIGSWIYEGQRLSETARGIKTNARLIRHGNRLAKSGIITEDTMITFRSRSSRIFWLVQIAAESFDYAPPFERERGEQNESVCETYFDRWISFVYRLFEKWKALEVTHSLTVVFFSRTFLSTRQAMTVTADGGSLDCKDVYGRPYEDHYKMVVENETKADWDSLVVRLREEFLRYPLEVNWNLSTGDLGRRPSNASQGNVLEAINITSNLLQFHYFDRDLHRTGNSIVLISPGCGVFEVDKGLASITYQRMMDNGIGSDMLSLGLPPLHIAPFFLYNNEYRTVESRGVDTSETYYEIPHWMHLAFISYEDEQGNAGQVSTSGEVELLKTFHSADTAPQVAANGFILPRKESFDSSIPSKVKADPNSPTSFSVNGIAASSPAKTTKVPEERSLNEGRDFLDILEACRPKNSGAIPSTLQAILKMYRRCERMDHKISDSFNEDTKEDPDEEGDLDELKPLKEWASMDLDLDEPFKVIRPRSGSLGMHDKSSDRSDASVLSSPSSSFTSLVGMSFDKHILGRQKGGGPLGGTHLQRSQSLRNVTLEGNDETDSVRSDGSWSTMGPEGTMDPGTDEELSLKGAQKERNRHANMLRKLMAKHDSSYFEAQAAPVPVAETMMSRPQLYPPMNESVGNSSPVAGVTLPLHRFPSTRNEPSQSGGIGAALSNFSVSHEVMAGGDNLSNRGRTLNPNDITGSTRSGRIISDGTGILSLTRNAQWNDMGAMGARGMSPLLLPPPGVPFGTTMDPPDLVRPEDRHLSSRLLPRDYSLNKPLGSRDGASSRSLNAAYTGRVGANQQSSGEVQLLLPAETRVSSRPDIRSSVISVGGGSPKAGDLYRGNQGRGHRHHRENASSHRHGRKKVFNPFRQADEDKVLAKRSHNRRRWSHVFPLGEIEFKRHAGPAWRSLCSPAILPLSVDFFPSRQEIDQFFQFNIYNVTLSDFENTHYSTHADVMMEMLRQRISQDYQLVPPSCVDETIRRAKPLMGIAPFGTRGHATSVIPKLPAERNENVQTIKHFLTMGHQLQEITYDPSSDTIEVVRFNEKNAQNDQSNTFKYQYLLYDPFLQKYTKVVQTFKKYADQYNWNKVDRIICGDEDKTLREGMRFRRVMFGLIPPKFSTIESEQEYIAKFKRLGEYLCKLRDTGSATFDVKITSSTDPKTNLYETRAVTGYDSMKRSVVQLRKGKQDPFEWIELATDSEFSTSKSYRILINWLAASSGKVDTQAQLLHRRCTQYGLSLTFFPQTSISRDLLLNPFKFPPTFCVRDDEKAKLLYTAILELDFVNDGVFYTQTKPILECIENGDEFDFGRRLSTAARQYVHRSGTLFVRLIRDRRGWVIVVIIPNGHHIKKDEDKRDIIAKNTFKDLMELVGSLTEDDEF